MQDLQDRREQRLLFLFLATFTVLVGLNITMETVLSRPDTMQQVIRVFSASILLSLTLATRYHYHRHIKYVSIVYINLMMVYMLAGLEGSAGVPRYLFLLVPIIFAVIFLGRIFAAIIMLGNIITTYILGSQAGETNDVLIASMFFLLVIGSLILLLVIVRESTHRENIELYTKLRDNMNELERTKNLELIVNGILHDVKNDLTVIQTIAELSGLELSADPPEMDKVKENIKVLTQTSTRSINLFKKIIEMNQAGPDFDRFDLKDFLRTEQRFFTLAIGSSVPVRLSIEDDLPPIRASVNYILQILVNLCLNARDAIVQARREAGHIMLLASQMQLEEMLNLRNDIIPAGNYVELRVRDNGIGIKEKHLKRIFDPFYTTKTDRGSGLGLMMVSMLLDEMGGYVQVETKEGQGSDFILYFPVLE